MRGLRSGVRCAVLLAGVAGAGAQAQMTPPPPVTTPSVPSSPPVPVTDQGGGVTTYPIAPAAPPSTAPGVPSVTPSGADPTAPPPADGAATVTLPGSSAPAPESATPAGAAPVAAPVPPAVPGQSEPVPEGGLTLVRAFELGREQDPTYRAAIAERTANRQVAAQTIAGYLPQASYSLANVPTEDGLRQVATVTQPIVSVSGWATVKQRRPRRAYAEATFLVREQDLATRTMTAVVDLIKATEAGRLNEARIAALQSQNERAERLYQSGLGTVTDARDIAVRYGQARANQALLESEREAAAARLGAITGVPPGRDDFTLPVTFGTIGLAPLPQLLERQSEANPQIDAARQTERINELEAQRIRGQLFPVVGATATYSRRGDLNNSYVGLSLTAPFNAGTLFQQSAARAATARSLEERRGIEAKARVELERLHALINGGNRALPISAEAIEAAQLSVDANSKSYEGGVRTNVDVVNAIQTLFEVKNEYVVSATTMATNLLNLMLLAGAEPQEALATTQRFLLGR